MDQIHSSKFKKTIDFLTFPIRALFFPIAGKFGLSSLREERMRAVAQFCSGRVLDIGCGPGNIFINNFIGKENGEGIDVFPYDNPKSVLKNMTNLPYEDDTFDTITLIAVGGHIPKSERIAEFTELSRVLKPNGLLIMTQGEPITQLIGHKWRKFSLELLGRLDMDSERGMKEDEEYCMPKKELVSYLNSNSLSLIAQRRIITQWGLNNVYISKKLRNKFKTS